MSKIDWVAILRDSMVDHSIDDNVARCYSNELKLMNIRVDGSDSEIAEAEYLVHLDNGGTVH